MTLCDGRTWLDEHWDDPVPSHEEKAGFAHRHEITTKQVNHVLSGVFGAYCMWLVGWLVGLFLQEGGVRCSISPAFVSVATRVGHVECLAWDECTRSKGMLHVTGNGQRSMSGPRPGHSRCLKLLALFFDPVDECDLVATFAEELLSAPAQPSHMGKASTQSSLCLSGCRG